MKKQEIQKIKDKVSTLLGQRVAEIYRLDDAVTCGFFPANRSEKIVHEQLKTIKRIESDYALDSFCNFRWTYQDRVILTRQDIFQPSHSFLKEHGLTIMDNIEETGFHYDEYSGSRFDEIVEQNFKPVYEQTLRFIVKKINVSKFGDLILEFENGYRLEIFIDTSDPLNCWAFSEIGVPNNITVGGNAIVEEDVDVTLT